MISLPCARCGAPCDLRAETAIRFHRPSGGGGMLCSTACTQAFSEQHAGLEPALDAPTHMAAAARALGTAHGSVQAAAECAAEVAEKRHAKFWGGGWLTKAAMTIGGGADVAEESIAIVDRLSNAEPLLQQALLHLFALRALGHPAGEHAHAIASFELGRMVHDDAKLERDRIAKMAALVERARFAVLPTARF